MKNTLKIAGFLIACLIVCGPLVSCSSNDDPTSETVIAYDQLPQSSKSFISAYYSSTAVTKVERDNDNGIITYEVTLANGHEVTFNSDGEWVEIDAPDGDSIPFEVIPPAIGDYLNANYQGYGVNDITRTGFGYEVELVTGVDLLFDSQGNFIRIDH